MTRGKSIRRPLSNWLECSLAVALDLAAQVHRLGRADAAPKCCLCEDVSARVAARVSADASCNGRSRDVLGQRTRSESRARSGESAKDGVGRR